MNQRDTYRMRMADWEEMWMELAGKIE